MSKFGIEFLKNPSQLVVASSDGVLKDTPDFQFRENGYLFVSSTPEGQRSLHECNRMQKENGVSWTHLMDPAAMAAKFPWLKTSDLNCGSFGTQNEGYFDPWSLLNALKSKVRPLCKRRNTFALHCTNLTFVYNNFQAISQGVVYEEGSVSDAVMDMSCAKPTIKSVIVKNAAGDTGEIFFVFSSLLPYFTFIRFIFNIIIVNLVI